MSTRTSPHVTLPAELINGFMEPHWSHQPLTGILTQVPQTRLDQVVRPLCLCARESCLIFFFKKQTALF